MSRTFPGLPLWCAALLLLLAISTGCSTVKVLHQDPEFSYAVLESGGLAVAPVTRRDAPDYYAAEPVAAAIHAQLTNDLPSLPVIPVPEVERILGPARITALQQAFHELVTLPPADFALLEPLTPHARFILFVSITRDEVFDNSGIYEVTSYESIYDPYTGEHLVVPVSIPAAQKGTTRSLSATYVIYDLALAREAWRARSAADGHITRSVSPYLYSPGVGVPGGPTPTDLIRQITSKIARQLSRR